MVNFTFYINFDRKTKFRLIKYPTRRNFENSDSQFVQGHFDIKMEKHGFFHESPENTLLGEILKRTHFQVNFTWCSLLPTSSIYRKVVREAISTSVLNSLCTHNIWLMNPQVSPQLKRNRDIMAHSNWANGPDRKYICCLSIIKFLLPQWLCCESDRSRNTDPDPFQEKYYEYLQFLISLDSVSSYQNTWIQTTVTSTRKAEIGFSI